MGRTESREFVEVIATDRVLSYLGLAAGLSMSGPLLGIVHLGLFDGWAAEGAAVIGITFVAFTLAGAGVRQTRIRGSTIVVPRLFFSLLLPPCRVQVSEIRRLQIWAPDERVTRFSGDFILVVETKTRIRAGHVGKDSEEIPKLQALHQQVSESLKKEADWVRKTQA